MPKRNTSLAAFLSLNDHDRHTLKGEILTTLHKKGAMTDEMLLRSVSPWHSPSSVRTRRAELCDEGLIRATGDLRKTSSGRNANVWDVIA